MRPDTQLEAAQPDDLAAIRELLDSAQLPHSDLDAGSLKTFICAREKGRLVGVAGLEVFGSIAMARSLAVAPASRGRRIGSELLDRVEELARDLGVTDLYGLTLTIEDLLIRRGFRKTNRSDAPPQIRRTPEFRGLCPDSAALLVKNIS